MSAEPQTADRTIVISGAELRELKELALVVGELTKSVLPPGMAKDETHKRLLVLLNVIRRLETGK